MVAKGQHVSLQLCPFKNRYIQFQIIKFCSFPESKEVLLTQNNVCRLKLQQGGNRESSGWERKRKKAGIYAITKSGVI